jgi:hypothetical protein
MISGFWRAADVDVDVMSRLWRRGSGGEGGFWRARDRMRVVLILGELFFVRVRRLVSGVISTQTIFLSLGIDSVGIGSRCENK